MTHLQILEHKVNMIEQVALDKSILLLKMYMLNMQTLQLLTINI
jgi:hypothetical protein